METYKLLTADAAISYIKEKTDLFSKTDILVAKEFSGNRQSIDCYCNIVVLIESITTHKSVILKQVLPFVRAYKEKGTILPLTLKRLITEVNYIRLLDKVIPDGVAKIYWWDETESILIMENLSRMSILRNGLIDRKKFPKFSQQIGEFLGKSAFYTSELFLDVGEKKSLENLFKVDKNDDLLEKKIFEDSILNNKQRKIYFKLKETLDDFCYDEEVIKEVKVLKALFMNKNQCLIHADLHSSNIFIDDHYMKVFDSEFARFGPISFDLGGLIGSLILNYASLIGMESISETKRTDYQNYLLEMIQAIYQEFEKSFIKIQDKNEHMNETHQYFDMKSTFEESVGFAACVSISRLYDDDLSDDFKRINNLDERAKGQKFVIMLAKSMLLDRKSFDSVEGVLRAIKALTLSDLVRDLDTDTSELVEKNHKTINVN